MKDRAWWVRTLSPPLVVGAVVAISAVGLPTSASAPHLAAKSPQQVLALLSQAHVEGLTGEVSAKAALGLPALPSGGGPGSAASGLTGLLTGSHSLRVWLGKAGQLRAQVLDPLDETEVVSDGSDLWTYVYSTNSATHVVLPARTVDAAGASSNAEHSSADLATGALTPDQLAAKVLAAADPSTAVTVSGTASIAGHNAYLLDIRPRTADTTIGLVQIGVEATTGVPLKVQIFARGASSAALTIGFTKVSFGAVDPAKFRFALPPGATVSSTSPPAEPAPANRARSDAGGRANAARDVVGTGWSSVLVLPESALMASVPDAETGSPRHRPIPSLAGMLAKTGTRVDGGTLLHTALINVLAADDGRVLVGAVPLPVLQKALTAATPIR